MSRPTVVMLRALGLGDLLTGVPAVRAVAAAFPGHRKILAAPSSLAELARWVAPIDEVVHTPGLGVLERRLHGADVGVDLHGKGPESHRVLLPVLREVPVRGRLVAFAHPAMPETAGSPVWRPEEHEVDRWCRLLTESGIPADRRDLDVEPPDRPVPARARGATLIHPGAAYPARRWPPERFAAVARHERAHGREVVVTAGSGELPLARQVAELAGCPPGAVLTGFGPLDLLAVVAAAGRVVCGDTGVAHVATAVGTPSVVLYGPMAPSLWGPPPERRQHVALWAGRRGDPHGAVVDRGLLALAVPDVVAALDRLSGATRFASAVGR